MRFPRDMFIVSLHHFRRVMCSDKYTIGLKDTAFDGLIEDYFRCELDDPDVTIFVATAKEWAIRRDYEAHR